MPWYFPWSDFIKKRACRYLLQHYLGNFLQEKLTLEQLTVDLYNGTGRVENVPLDVWSVNEMLESSGVPFEIIDGYIHKISVSVPWSALLNDSCCMDIQGLELTLAMRQRSDTSGSMTESMIWNNMTTSMELAQECLRQGPSPGEEQAEATQQFEGLESFAQTIESVLARIKLSFSDTVIRIEHLPKDTKSGIGLELHIKRVDYSDLSTELAEADAQFKAKSVYEPAAFAFKNLKIFGASAYLDEFHETARTMPSTFDHESPESPPPSPNSGASSPPIQGFMLSSEHFDKSKLSQTSLLPAIQIANFAGHQEIKLKIKQNLAVPGAKVDVECFLGTLNTFLAPRQVHLLIELANGLTSSDATSTPEDKGKLTSKPMRPEDYKRIEEDLHNQLMAKRQQHRHQEAQHRVDSWNFSFDSSTTAENSTHFSSGTEYDSVLDDEGEDKFYSMPSANSQWGHDILPPLEEPQLPADMLGIKKQSGSLLSQGFGSIPKLNSQGPSLTEAASSVFVSAQLQATSQGTATLPNKLHSISPMSPPISPGLAGIAALEDPYPETLRLKLKLSSTAITVLHVDPVLSPVTEGRTQSEEDLNGVSSSHPLLQMADNFFDGLGTYGFGGKDFEDMKERLVEACPNDHLRCILAPLSVDFEKNTSSSHQTVTSDMSVGRLELLEYLYDRSSSNSTPASPYATTQLLNFNGQDDMRNAYFVMTASKPCLRAKYKNTQRTSSPGGIHSRSPILPKMELTLELGKLCSEVDITIIDRIAALIYPPPLYATQSSTTHSRMFKSLNPTSFNQQVVFTQALDEGPATDQRLNVSLACPELTLMLRFPIPDLRPVVERRPWWKQAIRDESLLFVFSSLEFKTVFCSADPTRSYELRFRELDGYFKESHESAPVPVIRSTTASGESENGNGGFDWPRVVITTQPAVPLSVLEEAQSTDNSPLSSLEAYPVMKSAPSPFSSKPVMFEAEELVLPGTQEDMANFQQDTISSTQLHVESVLPRLDINLHTKSFFEKIYNRIASDLLLWEPTAPSPTDRPDTYGSNIGTAGLDLASQLLRAQGPDKFVMCRSGLRSYHDDSSSDGEDSSSFASPEHKYRRTNSDNGQTLLSVSLNVSRGRLALFPYSHDSSKSFSRQNSVSENEQDRQDQDSSLGEIMADLEDLSFFVAACYKGNVDLSYICLQAKRGTLQHAPLVPGNTHVSMETAFSGAELQSTLYQSEHGVRCTSGDSAEPMLSMAVKAMLDPTKNVKEILFTLALRDTTIRHRILPSKQLWLTQLSNYMDVLDDPVLGFVPPSVVTVLHTHVWGGAIDYRPIHLPLRVLLTLGSFSVSSNLTIESSISVLRFIIDDAALYISDKCTGQANLKYYVCVMDFGLFELSLLSSDGTDEHPKAELRMSSNTLNVRTCSDSCSALLQLIQYIAADGDMVPSYETEEPDSINATPTRSRCSSDPPVHQGSVDEGQMSSLMREAMVDDVIIGTPGEDYTKDDAKMDISRQLSRSPKRDLFLFPDDKPDQQLTADTSDRLAGRDDGSEDEDTVESDDEFCILDHPDREPEGLTDDVVIKTLVPDKIEIRENHFAVTIGRSDQLRAPDHFPTPVFRYSLREMSVVWHMYGGRDLGTSHPDEEKKKRRITFANDLTSPARPVPRPPPSPSVTAAMRARGGLCRQEHVLMELHINKIRFQYEDYPEDTEQASRLVFLAQEVEVRDRMSKSQINKFLYQYTCESKPKQAHANMVVLKMLYIRPDTHLKAQECCLRVSVQPLKLNVDQDALFFLRDFFTEVAGQASKTSKGTTSVESSPIKIATSLSTSPLDPSLDPLTPDGEEQPLCSSMESGEESPQPPTFFRSFIFSPEVPIRLDYQGKHVDMDQGTLAGLLIGLAQLNCSELSLKRLCCRSGLLGMDRVISYALQEWLSDIKRTQLPSILGGVGPVHSFVQLFQGMADLVWMPIEQYRRDGRVIRGLQRGANSFTTSSAMAFLELTNRAVQVVQSAAETAYDMVSPGPSVSPCRRGRHRMARQPADLREGVTNAYHVVAKGINRTASNIVKVAREEHEEKGVTGAVGGVLRQVPATMVQPLILATEATSNVIGGVRNQILPDARREATEKWRDDS